MYCIQWRRLLSIDTARIAMQSTKLSVCSIRPSQAAAAGLLPWAGRAGDVEQLLHGDAGGQQRRANAGSVTLTAGAGS